MVVAQYATAQFELVETLEDSERGEGGFGSTGKH
jgi:dUTPase